MINHDFTANMDEAIKLAEQKMREQAKAAFEKQKDEEHRLEAEQEAIKALEAPSDITEPVLQLELMSHRTNPASDKDSPELALEAT